jgi:two-component system response regulator
MTDCSVLLVEDNPDDEFLARWALTRVGISRISVAHDGREALDMLFGADQEPALLPDVVILDLLLPKVDGIEVLERIRGDIRTARLPVLVLSSSENPGDIDACNRLGVIDFYAKPLKPAGLRRVLGLIGSSRGGTQPDR